MFEISSVLALWYFVFDIYVIIIFLEIWYWRKTKCVYFWHS